MGFKLTVSLLLLLSLEVSCGSPSDEEHTCDCDYPNNTKSIIEGVDYFSDLDSGKECDEKCAFRRLLILFYDESDSSRMAFDLVAADPTLINTITDNFAVVCLSTENSIVNLELQRRISKTTHQPYFAVLRSSNDSLIASFGFMSDSEKIDSILLKALY